MHESAPRRIVNVALQFYNGTENLDENVTFSSRDVLTEFAPNIGRASAEAVFGQDI